MSNQSLIIKDGNGVRTNLAVKSGSYGLATYHYQAFPTSATKNTASVQYGGIDWTIDSGTFVIANSSSDRQGLLVFNPGPSELYISIGSGSKNGFTLTNTSSVPSVYSLILYPSGTYNASTTTVQQFHSGFYVSSTLNPLVLITSTE
jgi:hypothetical protein